MNIAYTFQLPKSRVNKIWNEFHYAWELTDRDDMKAWAWYTIGVFGKSGLRRGKRFAKGVYHLAKGTVKEGWNLGKAVKQGRGKAHCAQRGRDALAFGKKCITGTTQFTKAILKALKDNPKETAPQLFAGFLGFLAGSGGLDGDGGIPDGDLFFGIGFHRSILFHSIIAGMCIETITCSVLHLAGVMHKNLPEDHDLFWDNAHQFGDRILKALANGASVGIAYHLFVDATIDGGKAYSDLPFSMSMEGHETMMGVNAAAEGIDRAGELRRDEGK